MGRAPTKQISEPSSFLSTRKPWWQWSYFCLTRWLLPVWLLVLHGSFCGLWSYTDIVNPSAQWPWFHSQTPFAAGPQSKAGFLGSSTAPVRSSALGGKISESTYLSTPLVTTWKGKASVTQSFYWKTALELSHEYERQMGTKGHLAARKLVASAQYNVPWERRWQWDSAVLPFPPGLSLWPPLDTCFLSSLCLSISITAAACWEKHFEI